MVAAVQVRAPQADALVVQNSSTTIRATGGAALAVYNIPTPRLKTSQANVSVVYRWTAQSMKVTQAFALAVVRGTISNPTMRSWCFTLDGHDFWVLKLGTSFKTLVFDLTTGQWAHWATEGSTGWRASLGFNWRSSDNIAAIYGSNVVVGDDSAGALWVLDPEYAFDDSLFVGEEPSTFTRVATGQVPATGRNYQPVYSVNLSASFGSPASETSTVTLTYSDDQGNTYTTADAPIISELGNYDQEFTWRSLGVFRSPGRLFKITDDGAFARIDSMDVNS